MRKLFGVNRISAILILMVLVFFSLNGLSMAFQIAVDEGQIRGPDEYKGQLPLIFIAFADSTYPGQLLLGQQETPQGTNEFYWITALFDSGASMPGYVDNYCNYRNPGVFIGAQIAPLYGINYFNENCFPDNPDATTPVLSWNDPLLELNVHMYGLNAADPDTLLLPFPPGPGSGVAGPNWHKPTYLDSGWTTLVAIKAVKQMRALIDNRITVDRGGAKGPQVEFLSQTDSVAGISAGPMKVRLDLYDLLDDDPFTEDRWFLDGVTFGYNGNSAGSPTYRFLYDTATTFSAIDQAVAGDLGLNLSSPDFTCTINGNNYNGYYLSYVEMQRRNDSAANVYRVDNARICVEDNDPNTPRIVQSPPDTGGINHYHGVIGSNLFPVRFFLDGPANDLWILTDNGDLDGNLCIDTGDYDILNAELNKPTQSVDITGHVEIGTVVAGEGGWINFGYTSANFSVEPPLTLEIVEMEFNLAPTGVWVDADGSNVGGPNECGESIQRFPDPLVDTQQFGFTSSGAGSEDPCQVPWDLDLENSYNPQRADYYGGTVTITFKDGSKVTTTFNESDSAALASRESAAAASFSLNIANYQEPPNPIYDVNGDDEVNNNDLDALEALYDNPGGAPCFGGGEAEADLSVAKSDNIDPVEVGEQLTYTIYVVNNGPEQATGVQAIDTLPGTATFVSATASQGTCNQSAGIVTCDLGTLDPGVTATITIVVEPTAGGIMTNTANVTCNEQDPNPANDSATETTEVGVISDGDLDGDGDIDRDDINVIISHRNQPASDCPECDIDGDGTITILDAIKLKNMCTNPGCL